MALYDEDDKIDYLAYATSSNQLVFPKKLYWANSSNSVQLVYIRPVKELHVVNPSFYNNFPSYVSDITEIRLTSHMPNVADVVDNNIVNITHNSNSRFVKTYMWLTEDTNNVGKYIGYIGSPWYDDENSKFYCHEGMTQCFRDLKLNSLQHIVDRLDTSKVTAMDFAFYRCTNLVSLDVSTFKTDNVTKMNYIFSDCKSLTSLEVSNFKTDNVKDMNNMFLHCYSLTSLDVSNFKTDNVTNMNAMFSDCRSLTILDLSNFKTDNVTNMCWMFQGCSNLTSLDLSTFKTDKVTDMSFMFYVCNSLTSLNLGNFKTDNVKNMSFMFDTCRNLKRIISNTFSKKSLMDSTNAFNNCIKLVGSNGTVFNSTYTDAEYARVDGENGLPGYFTDPAEAVKITLINVDNENYTDEIYLCAGDTYTIPTLGGYTAVVTDNNGNNYTDGDTITITQDITLTFVWSANN